MARIEDTFMTGRQVVCLTTIIILSVLVVITYTIYSGFREAGHNRVKEETMFNRCISTGASPLECRMAVSGHVGN